MNRSSAIQNSRIQHRRGTVFHYYLMYLILSSTIMTTTGLCLHTVLKADRFDVEVARNLRVLRRLNSVIRLDFQEAQPENCTNDTLTAVMPSGDSLKWVIDDHRLHREVFAGPELRASDGFIFPRGTTLRFLPDNKEQLIHLRITEPVPLKDGSAVGSIPAGKSVELLIQVNPRQETEGTTEIRNSDGPAKSVPLPQTSEESEK